MSLKNSFSFFIVALFSLLLSTEAVVYAQTPREDPTRNSGSFLRQEQELEKRKNLPTQIPKSLLENFHQIQKLMRININELFI